jgi:hypothetical protein
MSKMDGLRAMREARYAEAQARARQAKPAAAKTATKAATKAAPVAPPAPATSAAEKTSAPEDGLCGHRSMNGRTCTREHGHAAKSHRYG